MGKSKKQIEFMQFMEDLVFQRFSKEKLQKAISDYLGTEIKIDWECYDDGGLSDYNAMFSTADMWGEIDEDLLGDFDIYYLKCKEGNQWGDEVYVTEVGFEFA